MVSQRDFLWLTGGIVAGVAIATAFPKLRRHLGPIIADASEKAGHVFSAMAETVATQMERAEDFAAERRSVN